MKSNYDDDNSFIFDTQEKLATRIATTLLTDPTAFEQGNTCAELLAPSITLRGPIDERILKDLTLIAYFDDPVFPYALKEILNIKENKPLLRLYEASLPSWTIVLA